MTLMTQEADDAARRMSVESLFADALAKAGTSIGDEPPRFAHVFSTALERVGSAVQEEAKAANLEQPPEPQVAQCEFVYALVPSQVMGLGHGSVGRWRANLQGLTYRIECGVGLESKKGHCF